VRVIGGGGGAVGSDGAGENGIDGGGGGGAVGVNEGVCCGPGGGGSPAGDEVLPCDLISSRKELPPIGGVGGGGGLSLAGVLLPSIPGIGGIGGGGAVGSAGARFDGSAGAKFDGGGGGGAGGAGEPMLEGLRIAGGGTGGFLPMGGVGFGFRSVSEDTDCDNGEAGM